MVSQAKWNKGKNLLFQVRDSAGTPEHPTPISHKLLEQARGFFNHLEITCEVIPPFLRGFHNSIDGWRDNRDKEGWKMDEGVSRWIDTLNFFLCSNRITEEEYNELIYSQSWNDMPPSKVLPSLKLF